MQAGRSLPQCGCKGLGLLIRFRLSGAAEFNDQEAATGRQEFEVFERLLLAAHGVEQKTVHAFEADGMMGEDLRDVVGCQEDVFKANAHEGAVLRALDELQRGAENDGAGSFAADQCARDVESILRKKLVQIEAGDAAGDAWKSLAHQLGVGVSDALEARRRSHRCGRQRR